MQGIIVAGDYRSGQRRADRPRRPRGHRRPARRPGEHDHPGGQRATLDLDRLAYGVRLVGTTFRTRGTDYRAAIAAGLRERLLPAIASGQVRAHVHEVFPADRALAALDLLRSGRSAGKVVLSFGP